MNIYAAIILTTLLVSFFLDLAASVLNLRALREELPAEFRDTYDAEAYRSSQQYARESAALDRIEAAVDLAALLGFWFLGGFAWLDRAVRSLDLGPIVTGVLFIGALVAAKMLLGLPFSLWSTFRIEERHGFNRTTARTFWFDRLKGLALGVALGVPLLAVLLWLFNDVGPGAWIGCWGVAVLFSLAMQLILPTWILPLFNRFTPLEPGELRDALMAYADRVGFPLRNVFVVDGSKRSNKSNAFFTGFGRNKRLALFDTLVASHGIPELVAVFGHEVGHHRRGHVPKSMLISFAHTGLVFYLLSIVLSRGGLYEAFGVESPSVWAGFVFFGLLYAPVELLLSVLLNAFSRHNEYEADRYAATTTGNPEDLVSALKRLSRNNLVNLTPHPFWVALHYSHPPILHRIRELRRLQPAALDGAPLAASESA